MRRLLTALFLFSTILSQGQSYSWFNLAQGGGGYITGLVIHPLNRNLIYARTDVGGIYRWNADSTKWNPITDMYNSSQYQLYSCAGIGIDYNDQNIVWALMGRGDGSTNQGLYKSANQGLSWTKIKQVKVSGNASTGYRRWTGEPIAVDPKNSNYVYVGLQFDKMLQSTDGGASFTSVTSVPIGKKSAKYTGIRVVAIDPSSSIGSGATFRSRNIYVNPLDTGIFVSNDGGSSWSQLAGSPTVVRGMKVASNGILYVSTDNAVEKYNPVTQAWTIITPPSSKRKWGAIDVANNDPSKIIVSVDRQDATTDKTGLAFYYSGTGGSSWSLNLAGSGNFKINYDAPWYIGSGRFASATAALKFDPVDPKIVYMSDWYMVAKTTDITAAKPIWDQLVRGHEEMVVPSVASFPHPLATDVAMFSGVADNGGFKHWNFVDYPLGYSSTPVSGSARLTTWQAMTGFDFCEKYPNYIASSGFQKDGKRGAFFVSNDKGQSFLGLDSLPGISGKCAYSATDSNLILAVVQKDYKTNPTAYVKRSTNRGQTWINITSLPTNYWDTTSRRLDGNIPIASDRVNGLKFYYIHKDGTCYYSSNGGSTWTKSSTTIPGISINTASPQIKAVRGHEGEVWIAAGGGGLWHSSNSGASYAKLATVDGECKMIAFGKAAPDGAFPAMFIYASVGGITGVYRSDDYGTSWVRINDDMHQIGDLPRTIAGDWEVFGRVYIGTGGRGVFVGQIGAATPVPVNKNPIATALVDKPIIYLSNSNTVSVTLTGSGTDADGTVTSYKWNLVNGANVTITNPNAATTTATGLTQGTYTFQLTVTDNANGIGVAEVDVVVYGAPMKIDNKKGRKIKFRTKY